MWFRYLTVALWIFSPTFLLSQAALTPAQAASSSVSIASHSRVSQTGQTVALVGKVRAEDGSGVGNATAVVLQCGSSERARGNADGSGDFSLSLRLIENEAAAVTMQPAQGSISTQEWNQCEVYGDAAGYTSERLHMFGAPAFGVVQVGTVVMHAMTRGTDSGPSVSVASLAAPEKAKKAFEKGQEQEKKGKWAAACDYFKRAVQVYPRYALAWLELGRSQAQQNDFTGAQQSFQQATEEDPHFVDAYVQIANIAVQKRQWKQLADATGRLVELQPDSTPNFWFLNSAANFNLGNIPQAESSATRGLRMDSRHQVPQLEYLYGLILARRGDYKSAISHVQNYLTLSPHAKDSADAQTKLAELEKLASSQNVTASR